MSWNPHRPHRTDTAAGPTPGCQNPKSTSDNTIEA